MTENNYDVFLSKDATNSQNSPYISTCPLEGVFWSELHTISIFVFVKFLKERVSCNEQHCYSSLLKDFYPFQSLKIMLLFD